MPTQWISCTLLASFSKTTFWRITQRGVCCRLFASGNKMSGITCRKIRWLCSTEQPPGFFERNRRAF
jgi:hypothetical protein